MLVRIRKRNPYTLGETVNYTTTMESKWRLLKVLKIELPYYSVIPLVGIYSKECKSGYNKNICTPFLLQHYSQYPSYGNSLDALQMMNGLRKCDDIHVHTYMYVCIVFLIVSLLEEIRGGKNEEENDRG
jgi:hypothetical protein